jgi:hypothetical protein
MNQTLGGSLKLNNKKSSNDEVAIVELGSNAKSNVKFIQYNG